MFICGSKRRSIFGRVGNAVGSVIDLPGKPSRGGAHGHAQQSGHEREEAPMMPLASPLPEVRQAQAQHAQAQAHAQRRPRGRSLALPQQQQHAGHGQHANRNRNGSRGARPRSPRSPRSHRKDSVTASPRLSPRHAGAAGRGRKHSRSGSNLDKVGSPPPRGAAGRARSRSRSGHDNFEAATGHGRGRGRRPSRTPTPPTQQDGAGHRAGRGRSHRSRGGGPSGRGAGRAAAAAAARRKSSKSSSASSGGKMGTPAFSSAPSKISSRSGSSSREAVKKLSISKGPLEADNAAKEATEYATMIVHSDEDDESKAAAASAGPRRSKRLMMRQNASKLDTNEYIALNFGKVQRSVAAAAATGASHCFISHEDCKAFGSHRAGRLKGSMEALVTALRERGYRVEWRPSNLARQEYQLYVEWSS